MIATLLFFKLQRLIEGLRNKSVENVSLGLDLLGKNINVDDDRDFASCIAAVRNIFYDESNVSVALGPCYFHIAALTDAIRNNIALKKISINSSFLSVIKKGQRAGLFQAIGTVPTLDYLMVDAKFCYDFEIDLVTKALCGETGSITCFHLKDCNLIGDVRDYLAFYNAMKGKHQQKILPQKDHVTTSNDHRIVSLRRFSLDKVNFPSLLTVEIIIQVLVLLHELEDVSLRMITAYHSLLGDVIGISIAKNLLQCCSKSLCRLSLEDANFGRKTGLAIAQAIRKYQIQENNQPAALQSLRIVNSSLGDEAGEAIIYELSRNTKKKSFCRMKSLTLANCTVGIRTAKVMAYLLKSQSSCSTTDNKCLLEHLDLSGNTRIGDEGCNLIAKSLAFNAGLKKLELYNCYIGDIGCIALANALQNNENLLSLDLRHNVNNAIDGDGVSEQEFNSYDRHNSNSASMSSLITNIGCKALGNTLENNWKIEEIRYNRFRVDNNNNSEKYQDKLDMFLLLNKIWNRNLLLTMDENELTKEKYVLSIASRISNDGIDDIKLSSKLHLSILYYLIRNNPSKLFESLTYGRTSIRNFDDSFFATRKRKATTQLKHMQKWRGTNILHRK